MEAIAAVFVLVGIISSAFASPSVVVLLVIISALAITIDAMWLGHFPIWFAVVAGVALQVGYVLGLLVQTAITYLGAVVDLGDGDWPAARVVDHFSVRRSAQIKPQCGVLCR